MTRRSLIGWIAIGLAGLYPRRPPQALTRLTYWPRSQKEQDAILYDQWLAGFRLQQNLGDQTARFEYAG